MNNKLIYLHIPKSGGTSQRLALYDIYGEDQVFWHGINPPLDEDRYSEQFLQDFKVIGGHKPVSYYPKKLDALYFSVVREPVARAVSLYSYYAKPDFAEAHFVGTRKKVFRAWQELGMDSESLINSLKHCTKFRNEIKNYQCGYLSRHGSTFEGVMQTLQEINAVIGEISTTTSVNAHMADLLGWSKVRERRANRSLEDTHDLILEEEGAKEALLELLQEDLKLYHFIVDEHQGLYSNASRLDTSGMRPNPPPSINAEADSAIAWNQVQMYSKGFIGLNSEGTGSIGIAIINHSKSDINYLNAPQLNIHYSAYDDSGTEMGDPVCAQPLKAPLKANGKVTLSLEVSIPEEMLNEAVGVRIWLALESGQPLTDFNPLHLASAHVIKI